MFAVLLLISFWVFWYPIIKIRLFCVHFGIQKWDHFHLLGSHRFCQLHDSSHYFKPIFGSFLLILWSIFATTLGQFLPIFWSIFPYFGQFLPIYRPILVNLSIFGSYFLSYFRYFFGIGPWSSGIQLRKVDSFVSFILSTIHIKHHYLPYTRGFFIRQFFMLCTTCG